MAAQLDAIERRDQDDRQKIQRRRAYGILQRLRRPERKQNIDRAKARARVEQQRQWMRQRERQRRVARPAMDAKYIEAAMRPVADRTVAPEDHQADQDIRRGEADGDQPRISG